MKMCYHPATGSAIIASGGPPSLVLKNAPSKFSVDCKKSILALLLGTCLVREAWMAPPAVASGWFGGSSQIELEKDPVEPFTLYGSIFKKYLIEQIVDGRVVARKKGFTASSCVNVLEATLETPELQALPAGLKVTAIGDPCCAKGEGSTREDSCATPCKKACTDAIARHLDDVKWRTGYVLDASQRNKVTEACSSQCFHECTKPGKAIAFVLPFRPQ